mmetsp:Transcript_135281/g.246036  ORF Transcript_135281/g.246036 Transcript_135281/m.246036 type:complete len:227 (-) Transcript_135281:228-908(-)
MEFTPWSISPPPLQEDRFFFAISLRKPLPFTFSKSSAALSPQESPMEPPYLFLARWVLSFSLSSLIAEIHLSWFTRENGTPEVFSSLALSFLSFLPSFVGASSVPAVVSGSAGAGSASTAAAAGAASSAAWASAARCFFDFLRGGASSAASGAAASSAAPWAAWASAAAASAARRFLRFLAALASASSSATSAAGVPAAAPLVGAVVEDATWVSSHREQAAVNSSS